MVLGPQFFLDINFHVVISIFMTQMLSVSNSVKLRFANDNGVKSSRDTHYIYGTRPGQYVCGNR